MSQVKTSLMDKVTLTKLITTIGRRGAQVHMMIQQAAVQAVAYSIVDRQIQFGQQLLEALTNGARKDSLVKYLETYGNYAWEKSERKLKFHENRKRDADGNLKPVEWNAQYALAVADADWSKAKKAPEPVSIYDVGVAINNLVEAAHRAIKSGKTIAHAELLKDVEAIAFRVNAAKYEAVAAKQGIEAPVATQDATPAEHMLSGMFRDPSTGEKGANGIPATPAKTPTFVDANQVIHFTA